MPELEPQPTPTKRGMFNGQAMAYAVQVSNQVLVSLRRLIAVAEQTRDEMQSHPERWVIADSVILTAATGTIKTVVPAGKRFVLRRITVGCVPSASPLVSIHDGDFPEATSCIDSLQPNAITGLIVSGLGGAPATIIGGRKITAQIAGGASGQTITVRYEGDLYDDRREV